jgi:hypothetical protein
MKNELSEHQLAALETVRKALNQLYRDENVSPLLRRYVGRFNYVRAQGNSAEVHLNAGAWMPFSKRNKSAPGYSVRISARVALVRAYASGLSPYLEELEYLPVRVFVTIQDPCPPYRGYMGTLRFARGWTFQCDAQME